MAGAGALPGQAGGMRSGLKAQAHAVLAKHGMAVPMSNLFGVGSRRLLAHLCATDARFRAACGQRIESLVVLATPSASRSTSSPTPSPTCSVTMPAITPSSSCPASARSWRRSSSPRSATSTGSPQPPASPRGAVSRPVTASPTPPCGAGRSPRWHVGPHGSPADPRRRERHADGWCFGCASGSAHVRLSRCRQREVNKWSDLAGGSPGFASVARCRPARATGQPENPTAVTAATVASPARGRGRNDRCDRRRCGADLGRPLQVDGRSGVAEGSCGHGVARPIALVVPFVELAIGIT